MIATEYTKYIEPTDLQKAEIIHLDSIALELEKMLDDAQMHPRYRALAKTSLEQTIMWANKGIYNAEEQE